ncbi:MAG: helix-turn-helix transcriptional regulator [Chitinophagales bacterium]
MEKLHEYRKLSERELRIMEMFSNGYTLSEISEKLSLSHYAVEADRVQVLHKLGAKNMIHAVKLAAVKGILDWQAEINKVVTETPMA